MQAPKVKAANVPECLRAIDSWILWRLVKSKKADGTETWLKVPYYADGNKRRGALGTKADRARLVSFKAALAVYRKGHYAGVGFATMPDYPLTILDLDSCIDDEGEVSDFGQKVIKSGTYVEYSPSGKGLRAVYTGEAVCAGKRNSHIESGERVEIYCGSAFVTITGNIVNADSDSPVDLPRNIKKILKPVVESGISGHLPQEPGDDIIMPIDAAAIPEMTIAHAKVILDKLPETWGQPGHGSWYRVAAALHLQFEGNEEAYQLLDEWSQGLDGYDEDNNRKRWAAGFSHAAGKHGLTTMRNLVFEAIQNGGLKVKADTMQKWGLARKVRNVDEDDFTDLDDIDVKKSVLPEYEELEHMVDISYMVERKAEPIDWLIDGLIPRGYVSFLAGGSGTSKSFFALQAAGRAATGEIKTFGGLTIRDGGFRTLYFAYEDNANLLHNRIHSIANNLACEVDVLSEFEDDAGPLANEAFKETFRGNLMVLPAEVLDSGDWQFATRAKKWDEVVVTGLVDYLRGFVERKGIDLLVFDTGSEIHAVEENAAPDMVVVMRALRTLAAGANIGVLVLQHVQKDIWNKRLSEVNQASIRGSSVLVDKSRNVFMLVRMPQADIPSFGLEGVADAHEDFVVLKHVKGNMGPYVPTRVFQRRSNGMLAYRDDIVQSVVAPGDKTEQRTEARSSRMAEWKQKLWEHIRGKNLEAEFPNVTQILAWCEDNGIPDSKAYMVLTRLSDEGRLIVKHIAGQHKKAKHWKAILVEAKANEVDTDDDDDLPASAWDAGKNPTH